MALSTAQLRESTTFHGQRVSRAHQVLMAAADEAGVRFTLNSGRRLLAEQEQLYRHPPPGTPLVARPTPNAPHIRRGRANHAWDVRFDDGGAGRLATFYRAHGVPIAFNVPGEPWHGDPYDEAALLAAARRVADPWRGYPADERRWMTEYDQLGHPQRSKRAAATAAIRRQVLRGVMTGRRKAIWQEAQRTGWHVNRRAHRYRSLRART